MQSAVEEEAGYPTREGSRYLFVWRLWKGGSNKRDVLAGINIETVYCIHDDSLKCRAK